MGTTPSSLKAGRSRDCWNPFPSLMHDSELKQSLFGYSQWSFKNAKCSACYAGQLLSFAWKESKVRHVFVLDRPLRSGALYRCGACHAVWYLDANERMMGAVSDERLPLVLRWNEAPIVLSDTIFGKLKEIGETPPDRYGNGREYSETPCGVVTKAGERIDIAIVSLQQHAPYEEWRIYRLASEIGDIYPSRYALPLEVREATSQAQEVRMGFAPTAIEFPDGDAFVLNWRTNFFLKSGYRADQAIVSEPQRAPREMPAVITDPAGTIYFVADS